MPSAKSAGFALEPESAIELNDVIMMEPTVQHAMRSLQPLTELGNLRRMDLNELRQAASIITDRHQAVLARAADTGEPREIVADATGPVTKN